MAAHTSAATARCSRPGNTEGGQSGDVETADIEPRTRIVQCVALGEVDVALRDTARVHPGVLEPSGGVLSLKLRCRKVVELVLRAAELKHGVGAEGDVARSPGAGGSRPGSRLNGSRGGGDAIDVDSDGGTDGDGLGGGEGAVSTAAPTTPTWSRTITPNTLATTRARNSPKSVTSATPTQYEADHDPMWPARMRMRRCVSRSPAGTQLPHPCTYTRA